MRRRWVLVALVVVAAGSFGGYALARPDPKVSSGRIPAGAQQLASELAVLRIAQTAADQSFLPTLRRVALRYPGARTGDRFANRFQGSVPSLTRLAETLPDGREVFLLVAREPASPGGDSAGLIIVRPNGLTVRGVGQPVGGEVGGQPAADLKQDLKQPSCFGFTDDSIVPDGIARVTWSFARQDGLGFVYKRPLIVNVPVHHNVAVATVKGRTPCESPNVVTLYAANGHVISSYGNAADLHRITRPVRHGRPWGP